MSHSLDTVQRRLAQLFARLDPAAAAARLAPRVEPPTRRLRNTPLTSARAIEERWRELPAPARAVRAALEDPTDPALFERNIENYIGTVKLPVGLAGPLRVNGTHAGGDYLVPLATTEAALVASYCRGAQVLTEAGGAAAALLAEGVQRAPGFQFATMAEAAGFVGWVAAREPELRALAHATTRHGRLVELGFELHGDQVWLILTFETGDASGQNMVTLAAEAICRHLVAAAPVAPRRWFVEGNLSGDKKATAKSFQSVRGKRVSAEALIPGALIASRLGTDAAAMEEYWRMSAVGGVAMGAIGIQGHFANGLAALFLATGQDVACVAEAATGITRLEARGQDLYATVSLPNLIVGTVGGGTGLPSQAAGLEILGLRGAGKARAFAEVAAALCLAGELSIIAALSAGHFARAHGRRARGR